MQTYLIASGSSQTEEISPAELANTHTHTLLLKYTQNCKTIKLI